MDHLAVFGSTTGFGLLWLVVLVIPVLIVVQVISAAISRACRQGLEDVIWLRGESGYDEYEGDETPLPSWPFPTPVRSASYTGATVRQQPGRANTTVGET